MSCIDLLLNSVRDYLINSSLSQIDNAVGNGCYGSSSTLKEPKHSTFSRIFLIVTTMTEWEGLDSCVCTYVHVCVCVCVCVRAHVCTVCITLILPHEL